MEYKLTYRGGEFTSHFMGWPAKLYTCACCVTRAHSAKLILIEGRGLGLWELAIPI